MKIQNTKLKEVAGAFLLAAISLTVNAQKLPNVQPAGIRAPETIKIDGRTTEWDDKFQAYNRATDIFYTLSNDDTHLYLTVQATVSDVISKIIGGGITLTVKKDGKKDDKGGISITYPIFEKNNRPTLGITRKVSIENGVAKTESSSPPITDSVIAARNKQLRDKSKYIGVIGIPGLDTLISVYNEDGIKTGQSMNSKGAYIYELAINLKLLGISGEEASKFAYHIIINGFGNAGVTNVKVNGDGSPAAQAAAENMANEMMSKMNAMNGGLFTPTDFWGEYTLAKKQ